MEAQGNAAAALRPGVGSAYGNGWKQLWRHFGWLLLIGVIYAALSSPFSILNFIFNPGTSGTASSEIGIGVAFAILFGFLGFLYSVFFLGPLAYGMYFAYLKAARDSKVDVGDVFAAFKNYWSAVGSGILVEIIIGVGLIFLIVPGIYLACKLAFVPYLVVDRKLGVGKALSESWRLASHGIAWKVFLIGLLGVPIAIAGFVVLGIGIIPAIMWISTAIASLYHAVSTREGPAPAPAPLPA